MYKRLMQGISSFIRSRLGNRPNLSRILANTTWLMADRVLRLVIGLFVSVSVARYLGISQFGLYSYAVAFVGLFLPLSTLGMDGIIVRDLSQQATDKDELLGTTLFLRLSGSVVAFVLTTAIVALIRPGDSLTVCLVAMVAAGMVFQAFDTVDLWFQSQMRPKYSVWAKHLAFLLIALLKIVLIEVRAPLVVFAAAGMLEFVLAASGMLMAYSATGQRLKHWRVKLQRAKRILSESWPMAFAAFAIMVYVKIDQVMLGQMLGDGAVGVYSAAVRISELWYFVPSAIVSAVSPVIMKSKKADETLYYQQLQKTFDVLALCAYAVAIPISLLAPKVIDILYGSDYVAAGPILVIHIWQGLFVFLGVARSVWVASEGLFKSALATTSFGAILNILLNWFLIPRYGPVGSALATVISYGASDYLIFLLYPYAPFRRVGLMMTKALTLQILFSGRDRI